jgi:ABC-2 type transport system ATP-binding protein
MPAVSVKGVSKRYRIFRSRRDRLKEALSFGRRKYGRDFWALQDIDLEVEPGTTLGIIGRNGAGKSTLLSIIAGIRQPTTGMVEVNGRLVALSGLGAGFNPEFTGRENIMLNGLILGIERREMLERFDDIAAFADIGEFMDQPIKTYSSGMRSRLGFAVAINVEPDVLILDETLAAGDAVTREAALQKMYELRDSGTTILLVSHGMSTIEGFCTEAILLHEGRLMAEGETTEVIEHYQALASNIKQSKKLREAGDEQELDELLAFKGGRAAEKPAFGEVSDFEERLAPLRSGTGEAIIRGVEVLDERHRPAQAVPFGSTVTVRVYLEYLEAVKESELIISLHEKTDAEQTDAEQTDAEQTEAQERGSYESKPGHLLQRYERYREDPGSVDKETREFFEGWEPPQPDTNGYTPGAVRELFSASTALEGVPLEDMVKGKQVVVDFTFKVPLQKGRYDISAGVRALGDADSYLDRIEVAATFRVARPKDRKRFRGAVYLPTEIRVHSPAGERQGQSA